MTLHKECKNKRYNNKSRLKCVNKSKAMTFVIYF